MVVQEYFYEFHGHVEKVCIAPTQSHLLLRLSGLPGWWNEVMDELGWLWKELPVFMPDLYPEFYSGDAASKPADLKTCTSQNASGTLVRLTT